SEVFALTFEAATPNTSDAVIRPANGPSSPITTPTPQGSSANAPFLQGVYVGPADPSGVKSFATATSTNVSVASDYLPSNGGWAAMDGANGSLNWLTSAWKNSGYTLSLGVPMIPTDSSGDPQGSLALGASGSYDGYFITL